MKPHRPNSFLNHLHSPEYQEQQFHRLDIGKQIKNQVSTASIGYNPTIGKYYQYTWKGGFDPTKDIMVTMDGDSHRKIAQAVQKELQPAEDVRYHSHDFFEIVYVYSGQCRTLISGRPTRLCAGDICLYNLQAVHNIEFSQPNDRIFNIVIRKDLFHRLLLELLAESDALSAFFINSLYNRTSADTCIFLKPHRVYQCEMLVHRIIELYYQEQASSWSTIKAHLMMLMGEIARQHQETCGNVDGTQEVKLSDVITYINQYYQDATLESTSRRFGYSTRSMTRFLQKHTGYCFREVIQDIRFSHARTMLQETQLSIGEIAMSIGYKDRSNFELAFKKYCHITPAAYRRQFSVG